MSEIFVTQGSHLDNPSMNADLNRVLLTGNKPNSVRSMKSVGGLSIFQNPEASGTLPRDEELTYPVYDAYTEDPKAMIPSSTPVGKPELNEKKNKKIIKVNSKSSKKGRYIISADPDLQVSSLPMTLDEKKPTKKTTKKSNVALKSTKGNVPKLRKDKKLPLTGIVNKIVTQNSREDELEQDTGERKRTEMVVAKVEEKKIVEKQEIEKKSKVESLTETKHNIPPKTDGKVAQKKEKVNPTVETTVVKTQQEIAAKKVIKQVVSKETKVETKTEENSTESQSSTLKRQKPTVEKQGSFTFKSTHTVDTGRSRKEAPEYDEVKNMLEDSLSRRILRAKKESDKAAKELTEDSITTSTSTVHTTSLNSLAEEKTDGDRVPQGLQGASAGNSSLKQKETIQNQVIGPQGDSSHSRVTAATPNTTLDRQGVKKENHLVKDEDFKAKVRMLVAQRPVESAASAPSSMPRRKPTAALEMKAVEIGDIDGDPKLTSTFPRSPRAPLTISSTPTSPIEEMRDTIKSGKVGLLIEDKFKNLNLTGRSMDATTLERQKRKQEETDPTKKYKFVVEGIDVPAPPESETPNTPSLPMSPLSSTIPMAPPLPGASETPSGPSTLQRLKKDGFSYLLDEKLAGEIMKRAADVTATKPHEAVEHGRDKQRESKTEDARLVQARAKLQKQDSLEPVKTKRTSGIIEDARNNLHHSPIQVNTELVMNEQEREDHKVPEVTNKNDEKNLDTVVASPEVIRNASVSSVQTELQRKETTSFASESVATNTHDAVAHTDMEVELHRPNGHAMVTHDGRDMLTTQYALDEVRRNPRTEYEAKKTVVKEVKTTKKVLGSRGPVDGPTETQTQQRAAITSVVKASSRGQEKKPTVTSEVRTSTETTQKEDGKILSQQKSSETKKNQSGKTVKATQRAVTESDEDDVTETKRRLQARNDAVPVIEAELQPREHMIVSSSFDRHPSNDEVFDAELAPLYVDPSDAAGPQHYSPASYSSRGMTSGASTPVYGSRGGNISLRPLRVDAGASQSRHTRVSTHPAPASPRQSVQQQQHQQPTSSYFHHTTRPYFARSHSSSAYDRRKQASTMPSSRIHGPYIEPSMTLQGSGRRFLRVDETRSGMIPRYRTQDISVRDTAPRARSTMNLTRLDPQDYVDLSVSDPDLSRNPAGRPVVQRVVERRVNHMDLHPDALRRQRGYSTGRLHHGTMGSSRSDLGGVRSPIAVDTKLQEISRTGKDYHVTLKLNSTTAPSPRGTLKSTSALSPRGTLQSRDEWNELTVPRRRTAMEDGYATVDRATVVRTGSQPTSLLPRLAHLQFQQHFAGDVDTVDASSYRDPVGSNKFTTHVGHYEDNNNNQVRADNSFYIKSVNRSEHDQVHLIADVTSDDTDVDNLHAHRSTAAWTPANTQAQPPSNTQPKQNGSEPRFSMMINQTMTMDYAPTDGSQPSPVEENIDPNRAGPNNRAPPPKNTRSHTQTSEHIVITDDRRTKKRSPKPVDEDLLSPSRNKGQRAPNRRRDSPVDEHFSPSRNTNNQAPYRPGDSEEDDESDVPIDEHFMPQRSAPVSRPNKKKGPRPVEEDMLAPSRNPRNEQPYRYGDDEDDDDDDDEEYYDDDEERHSEGSDLPKIVRGSILIKNSIDTTSGPKVVDIVEGDSDDEDFNVEDNTNMFHGQYFQARENPLYSSQEDLRDMVDGESPRKARKNKKQPKFTKIFQKQSTSTSNAKGRIPNGYDNDDFDTDIKVTRDYGRDRRKGKKQEHMVNGHNDQQFNSTSKTTTSMSQFDVNTLLAGAPPDSIKQTINVEREEEEIMGPLPDGHKAGPDGLLNFDTVSEKVDLGLVDGKAQVAVKVRCERIVPIRGVDDLFKKSSVIVTRLIEIDLQATNERRRLYQHIMKGSKEFDNRRLNTKDTFKLYKTFMGLAEADEGGAGMPQMTQIDRQVEDERRPDLAAAQKHIEDVDIGAGEFDYVQGAREFDPDELNRDLEDRLVSSRSHRSPEPDTISYLSAASDVQDILY